MSLTTTTVLLQPILCVYSHRVGIARQALPLAASSSLPSRAARKVQLRYIWNRQAAGWWFRGYSPLPGMPHRPDVITCLC